MARAGGRVLLVEDIDAVRRLLADVLAEQGFAVTQAASLEEALAALHGAEIVVTDLELGDGSGLELIGALADRPQLQVIAMSGNPALLREASIAGAIAVLAKPFAL